MASSRTARRVEANVTWLLAHPLVGRFVWCRAEDALRLLGLETADVGVAVRMGAGQI
jgi:hypothetical protein